MRFHVVGLPHTVCSKEYLPCAYTQKVFNFCKMMKSLGHTVYHYGGEGSDPECTEHISTISHDQRKLWWGHNDWRKQQFDIKWDINEPYWKESNGNAVKEIGKRLQIKDFICVIGGLCQKPIADAFPQTQVVEFGIGYEGVFAKYRIFESYAWMHCLYGKLGQWGQTYDEVIPNYYDPKDFPFSAEKDDYFLFVGRLISSKGGNIAAEMANTLGARLLVAGQGATHSEPGLILGDGVQIKGPGIKYVGTIDVKRRGELMSRAKALILPTQYIGPFEGVTVEAQMCFTEETKVLAQDVERSYSRLYSGVMFQLDTDDATVQCTSEHPFLTQRGWVPAGNLALTDRLVRRQSNEWETLDTERIGDLVKRLSGSGAVKSCSDVGSDHQFIKSKCENVRSTQTQLQKTPYADIGTNGSIYEYTRIRAIRRKEVENVPVYNLGTRSGTYEANGLVVHNCGTPVITTDWGCYTETVLDGVTGYRCRTLGEFVQAGRDVEKLNPETIRNWAMKYSIDVVRYRYEDYFHRLLKLWGNGWYDLEYTGNLKREKGGFGEKALVKARISDSTQTLEEIQITIPATLAEPQVRTYLEIGTCVSKTLKDRFENRNDWKGTSIKLIAHKELKLATILSAMQLESLLSNNIDLLKIDLESYDHILLNELFDLGCQPTHIIFETCFMEEDQLLSLDNRFRDLGYQYQGTDGNNAQYSKRSVLLIVDPDWSTGSIAKDLKWLSSWKINLLSWGKYPEHMTKMIEEYDSVISFILSTPHMWPILRNHGVVCCGDIDIALLENKEILGKCLSAVSTTTYNALTKTQYIGTLQITPGTARLNRFSRREQRPILTLGWCGTKNSAHFFKSDTKRLEMFVAITEAAALPGKITEQNYTYDNMQNFYDTVDLLICTSITEGGPLGAFEAIACGVPVISTNVGALKEMDSVWKFSTVEEAVLLINKLNSNPKELENYRNQQYDQFQNEFCMEKQISKWEEFFKTSAHQETCFL